PAFSPPMPVPTSPAPLPMWMAAARRWYEQASLLASNAANLRHGHSPARSGKLLRAGEPERLHERAPFLLLGFDVGADPLDRRRIERQQPDIGGALFHVGGG